MSNVFFNSSSALPVPNPSMAPGALCPGTLPLVLLPIRLETRFFTLTDNTVELRIRVYPDKIHADTHHLELTTDERTQGKQYWQQDWAAGSETSARNLAWATLADRYGAERAAYIARVLTPTNAAQRGTPNVAPAFPTLAAVGPNGESAWRNAPMARLLPDRWTAVVQSGGQAALWVTGKDISQTLALGPDPQGPPLDAATQAAVQAGEQIAIDPAMQWMVDFATAEAVGMGMRMTIPPAVLTAGLDSLVVFGVAGSVDVATSAARLAALLDAHHYTDGLEFLPFGTPTNNTDDRRAAYSSQDPGHTRSFDNEVLSDPQNAPNAGQVGAALGLSFPTIAPTLGRLGQAPDNHDLDARSMNTALWQVGWGYYLSNMIGAETGLTPDAIDWARGHFLNYVRGCGPFPSLRCGSQPYGILPVTSLNQWALGTDQSSNAGAETWLRGFLQNLRDKVWRPVLGGVSRIGQRVGTNISPDADLADLMQSDALGQAFFIRYTFGRHYMEHLYALGALDFTSIGQSQVTQATQTAQLLQLPSQATQLAHVTRTFTSESVNSISGPLIQTGEISPWTTLSPDYIQALLTTPTIAALIALRPDPTALDHTRSLLEALLRHSMLREIASAAARILATQPGYNLATLLRDLELVDLVDATPVNHVIQPVPLTLHWRRQLDQVVAGVTGTDTIGEYLEKLQGFTDPSVVALGQFRDSLGHLRTLTTETLQYLLQSTLDLSGQRLDAWITSFATKRLALMNTDGPKGQYIGAYGWVENLQPPQPAATTPTVLKDSGFIHAPSLTHASAAALLRNAHLGPQGTPAAGSPFSIDLSSRRAREAARLTEGVRQGQPLGALLGYRFERTLHDQTLDRFIAPLRNVAPLAVRQRSDNTPTSPTAAKVPTEKVAANNVVDGLVLLQLWQAATDTNSLIKQWVPDATADESARLTFSVALLADSVDGLSDALTAETAYQMARGNTSRVATTLAAIAQGDAPPPELEVLKTPRTGNSVAHRLMVLMSGIPTTNAGWLLGNSSSVSNCEPILNAWVSRLLGDATKVRCTVEQFDPATGAVTKTLTFPLSEVRITQSDFIYGVDIAGGSGTTTALCFIEQWVLYQAQRRAGGFGAQPNIRLQHARPGNLAVGETTLFDMLEQGRAIRLLLQSARAILPSDLCPPGGTQQGTLSVSDLTTRVARGETALNTAHQTLQTAVTSGTATADVLRANMLALGVFCIGPAVPVIAVGDTPDIRAALIRQGNALLDISAARLDQGATLRTQPAATDPVAQIGQLLARARAVFGDQYIILPRFTCSTAGATELKNALAASTQQQGGDPLAVHGWFTRYSRVRDNLSRFGACLRASEVLGATDRLNLSVAQLPFDATERWVGLPMLPNVDLPANKLSMALQLVAPFDATQLLGGLLVDEWVEVVPNKAETTALTFQYDPPNAFAPQNILVAVPPVPGQAWNTQNLWSVLVETLDLAKLRGVDPSLLGSVAQYLPALFVPYNVADDAVSTHFAPLTP